MAGVALCAPLLWLLGWLITGHKGWAWLPVASTAALLPLLGPLGPGIDRLFPTLPAVLAFLVLMGLGLYAASRAASLAVRVVVGALLIPSAFLVTFYVGVTASVGSIS